MLIRDTLDVFDGFLADRGLAFEGVVIGGAALILLEFIRRATDDVDCLYPQIPAAIQDAALEFASARAASYLSLRKDWFNNGSASLTRDLPAGWLDRTVPLFNGRALRLKTLGRLDLLRSKLFAFCDRQEDLDDCLALKATHAPQPSPAISAAPTSPPIASSKSTPWPRQPSAENQPAA